MMQENSIRLKELSLFSITTLAQEYIMLLISIMKKQGVKMLQEGVF